LGRLKKPPALSSGALHHLLWDYGIVFTLRQDTAIAPSGGRSYYSCTSLEADLFGGGDPALFILGWTPRGLAGTSPTPFLGPRPDSSML
jgi:hypothetical protein